MIQNNTIDVTKVTVSDKDCFEIAAFERYFPDATHLLCQFHALKAFDVRLNKKVDGKGLKSEEKDEIREHFRKAMYADTEADYNAAQQHLLGYGNLTLNPIIKQTFTFCVTIR